MSPRSGRHAQDQEAPHLRVSEEWVGDGARDMQDAQRQAVQNAGPPEPLALDGRRHLKGELESVRVMIAEMQALRTAVQHGELDVAMVPLLL
jgi:hypothetical protein